MNVQANSYATYNITFNKAYKNNAFVIPVLKTVSATPNNPTVWSDVTLKLLPQDTPSGSSVRVFNKSASDVQIYVTWIAVGVL